MDRFSSMGIFVKAVELGSFSAVADALNMSPQLVGKHVQFLEQHLGVRLLNRTTRRQHLTEVGSQFYERCRNILAEVESAEALAAETRAVPRGKLRVNAPVTFGIHALAPKLPKYLSAHPEVSIDLSLTNRMVDLIDEGYDTVFRIGDLAGSGLIARRLDPYRLVACAAPSYLQSHGAPSRPDDLRNHECLIFSHTMLRTHWDFEGPEGSVSIPISGRLMIDNGEALLNAALAGLGIVLQSFELIQSSLETGALVPILPGYSVPTRPLHILYAPDRRVTPKLRSFLDFVSAEFGSHGSA
ncbi:LysR family transcriptional regulator [Rhizobium sp. LEGMi135b]